MICARNCIIPWVSLSTEVPVNVGHDGVAVSIIINARTTSGVHYTLCDLQHAL